MRSGLQTSLTGWRRNRRRADTLALRALLATQTERFHSLHVCIIKSSSGNLLSHAAWTKSVIPFPVSLNDPPMRCQFGSRCFCEPLPFALIPDLSFLIALHICHLWLPGFYAAMGWACAATRTALGLSCMRHAAFP